MNIYNNKQYMIIKRQSKKFIMNINNNKLRYFK